MADVFWTIVIVWLVYRLYNSLVSPAAGKGKSFFYQNQQNVHQHYYHQNREGEVKVKDTQAEVPRKPNSDKGGEYIDFEEIK
ncbi:MAG: DUF4834 family protein [Bacteroidetes bacterium]|nr:DUF4834 family protein [Bacteroidota bacterium]